MLAAETAFEAMAKQDFSLPVLETFQSRVENSWIKTELWPVRNFHQGFENGFLSGMFHAGIQQFTGGRGLHAHYSNDAGHRRMKHLQQLPADGGAEAHIIGAAKGDGKLTFDKLTDLYYSGTKHEEDQPAHLVIHDTDYLQRALREGVRQPLQELLPGQRVRDGRGAGHARAVCEIHLNPSNCVHCKTCDIMDPYEIITWVPPEGGGGPNYEGM